MGILAVNTDYTDRDFAALNARLRTLILSVFPAWTDDQVANFGNLLVELYGFVGDVLGYYQDAQAAESRITTATQRKNLLALARLVGFKPAGATAATVSVTLTLSAPVQSGRTVTFNPPAFPAPTNPTAALTEDADSPLRFELQSVATITAGNSTAVAVFAHSERQPAETFAASGLPDQEVRLSATPYLENSAVVSASNGSYTQVDNFLASTASDRHFTATTDQDDVVTIRFGNGTAGALPTGTITVDYRTGGGLVGNVAANALKKMEGSYIDSAGDPVTVTPSHAQAATGGADRDTDDEIRELAPQSVRALTRTVARDDFEIHALQLAGIDRALMLTRNEDGSIAENAGNLIIVPTGTGFPTTTLKNQVLDRVTTTLPSTVTFACTVLDPQYLDVGVQANIFLKPGYTAASVRLAILAALTSFFAPKTSTGAKNALIDFGFYLKQVTGAPAGELALSDVFNVIRDVPGVRKVDDALTDFRLSAYRVVSTTTTYTGGGSPAVLVQALAHTDVPINVKDFPRLKRTTINGAVLDVDLTIDGVNYPPA